ncbi:MAG: exosortase/archaeosortase family protein [Armatimonadetes bacterium]|nr:exosortase/archaeosortase family protein [Armatimonadota bacterium]
MARLAMEDTQAKTNWGPCSWAPPWPLSAIAWAAAIALLMLLVYWEVGVLFVSRWFSSETYYHCIAVPPLLGWLVYQRRAQLSAIPSTPSYAGIALLGFGLLLVIAGARIGFNLLTGVSFPFVVGGLILLLWGPAALRVLAMPVLVAFFLIAPPMHALALITMPMQKASAWLAAVGANLVLGLPVEREGINLFLDGHKFVVAEQCSGMSSFLALSLTVIFLIEISGLNAGRKLLAMVSLPPIVISANVVRLSLVLLTAQYFGPQVAMGDLVHGGTDALVYLSALVLVILFLGALLPRTDREADNIAEWEDEAPVTE